MYQKLTREVRILKFYSSIITVLLAVLFIAGFTQKDGRYVFEEIDVERINIVEADGQLRMVISNKARQHPGIVNGKVIERTHPRPPGLLFFNQTGDEMGGLVFDENGENGHFGSLTFDKFRGDQTIGFRHLEGNNGKYSAGLQMWQQPNIPGDVLAAKYDEIRAMTDSVAREAALQAMRDNHEVTTERLFLGKGRDDNAYVILSDINGNPRLVMSVAPDGAAKIEFWDENGDVTHTLPAQ